MLSAAVPDARGQGSVFALPRGVADPVTKVGAVTSFAHTVYGVNLENGKTVWETSLEGVPLAVLGRTVLVLASDRNRKNVGRVTAVDTITGQSILRSAPLVFPDWAVIEPRDDHYFGQVARFADGLLWVKWLAMTRKPGDMKAEHTASGALRIDIKALDVQMLGADKMPPPALPPGVSKELAKLAVRNVETAAGAEPRVAVVGNLVTAVDSDKKAVTLKRWDLQSAKALAPVVLVQGGRFRATPFPAEGLVVVRPVTAAKAAKKAPVWQVYSLDTGKRIARVTAERDAIRPTILGSRLFYAFQGKVDPGNLNRPNAPMAWQLRCVDLHTGEMLWTRQLEDLRWDPVGPRADD
jgi:outer membrane protein assembly factor BamB